MTVVRGAWCVVRPENVVGGAWCVVRPENVVRGAWCVVRQEPTSSPLSLHQQSSTQNAPRTTHHGNLS
jgi:hypothetical protein